MSAADTLVVVAGPQLQVGEERLMVGQEEVAEVVDPIQAVEEAEGKTFPLSCESSHAAPLYID